MTAKVSRPRFEIDRQNAVDPTVFVFARASWVFIGTHPENMQIDPRSVELGSWSKPPSFMNEYHLTFGKVYAILSCPNCGGISMVADKVTRCDVKGKLDPDFACTHSGCGFRRAVYLDNWNDRVLYACAYWKSGRIEIAYCHGSTPHMARMELGMTARDSDIISIGPAIGFFVDEQADKSGKILTAD